MQTHHMGPNYRITKLIITRHDITTSLVCILAVAGSIITVSAGLWDAISHMQKEPEFFWSAPHMVVYTGVTITCCAAVLGAFMLRCKRHPARGSFATGIKMVIIGSAVQIVSGFGDSLSHDMFGIDGLISWSHQPLEAGLVLASLGGFMVLRSVQHARMRSLLVPPSIIAFLFFTAWLAFNLILAFGHVIQCIPVYEIFSSGCVIL